MLRKILVNYEFSYQGNIYKSYGVYVGDTSNTTSAKNKDYSADIICLTLRMSNEELARRVFSKYWDITRAKLEANGFRFRHLEIDFYPKPRKGEV